ncbi:MAG: alpha/beta hydrolase [Acidobacteria bacterium]|nr:alpha/beta hydrolase [Acidobacteriota bacterium]
MKLPTLATTLLLAATSLAAQPTIRYQTIKVQGQEIFYREAGPANAPTLLLLHGFPTSSAMFRDLMPRLADTYHVIAPDYPGYGRSSMPSQETFAYTFAHLTDIVEGFTIAKKLDRYVLYVMDYGAPIGYRLALRHPEKVTGLIVQNGNAYEEGLGEFWVPLKKLWADPSAANKDALRPFLKIGGTQWQYTNGVTDPTLLNPDAWTLDQAGLDRPGNEAIQLALFQDYGTNVPLYPQFQAFFRKYQPPTILVWGKNDAIFPPAGAYPYLKDLPQAELHLYNTGHFALETHHTEIGAAVKSFFAKKLAVN